MKYIFFPIICLFFLTCEKQDATLDWSAPALYHEFWTYVDENYIFFEHKQVNWSTVYDDFGASLNESSDEEALFQAMNNSLLALKDNHNRLVTPFAEGTPFSINSGYDVNFSWEIIHDNYLQGAIRKSNGITYAIVDDIIYCYLQDVRQDGKLRQLIRSLASVRTKGLIIDVRNNGGGDSDGIPLLLGDFVQERQLLGYYVEKSGPAHDDITAPIAVYANPNAEYNFGAPVVILTNRNTYSAASYLAAMFKGLPQVQVIGQISGGGAGGNLARQLTNEWIISVSVSDFLDKKGITIEGGVVPDITIENTQQDIENGRDRMLERAFELIND